VRPDGSTIAYDTGPGNALLDLAAYRATGRHCDVDGALAAQGRVRDDLLHRLLTEPYYAAEPPKSTGKELFHGRYLDDYLDGLTAGPHDLLATLTELTARTVADACARHGGGTVVASGGGVENLALMRALAANLPGTRLVTSDELGLPRDTKEAYLGALLAWLTWHGLPANVPSATGARGPRLLGSIAPGAKPLVLPPRHPGAVTRVRVAVPPSEE
jgi:anhydro-N-acetylmuramic acid kinase